MAFSSRVLVIHAGGTFGMVKAENGLVPVPGRVEKLITSDSRFNRGSFMEPIYEATGHVLTGYRIYEMEDIKDSSEAKASDSIRILEVIKRSYFDYTGFIVIHGTDTMCYAGSLVANMIRQLDKPVVFTGAMVPWGMAGSDAASNLRDAFETLARTEAAGVFLQFNGSLNLIENCYKQSTTTLDAFRVKAAVHGQPTAGRSTSPVSFSTAISENIFCIKATPYGNLNIIRSVFGICDGMVIEAYGDGNLCQEYVDVIKKHPNVAVMIVTQCRDGSVDGCYASGNSVLSCHNAINGGELTTEAALARLAVAVGKCGAGNVTAIKMYLQYRG